MSLPVDEARKVLSGDAFKDALDDSFEWAYLNGYASIPVFLFSWKDTSGVERTTRIQGAAGIEAYDRILQEIECS